MRKKIHELLNLKTFKIRRTIKYLQQYGSEEGFEGYHCDSGMVIFVWGVT